MIFYKVCAGSYALKSFEHGYRTAIEDYWPEGSVNVTEQPNSARAERRTQSDATATNNCGAGRKQDVSLRKIIGRQLTPTPKTSLWRSQVLRTPEVSTQTATGITATIRRALWPCFCCMLVTDGNSCMNKLFQKREMFQHDTNLTVVFLKLSWNWI